MGDAPSAPEGEAKTEAQSRPAEQSSRAADAVAKPEGTDAPGPSRPADQFTPQALRDGSYLRQRMKEIREKRQGDGEKEQSKTTAEKSPDKQRQPAQQSGRDASEPAEPQQQDAPREVTERKEAGVVGDASDRRITEAERREREKVAQPTDGVGFRFGSADLDREGFARYINSVPDAQKERWQEDPETRLVIEGSASRPGSDQVNDDLSQRRAETLAEGLREWGFAGEIEIVAAGESEAMRDNWPEDMDRAEYRSARVVAEVRGIEFDREPEIEVEVPTLAERKELLPIDLKAGEWLMRRQLGRAHEAVKEIASLLENPVDGPKLVEDLLKDLAGGRVDKGILKAAAGSIVGSFAEIVRSGQAKEVWAQREPLYRAYFDGVAAALDPKGVEPSKERTASEQVFFEAGREAAGQLGELEQYRLRLALLENYRQGLTTPREPTVEYFYANWSGGTLRGAAAARHPRGYEQNDYKYR